MIRRKAINRPDDATEASLVLGEKKRRLRFFAGRVIVQEELSLYNAL